MSIPTTSPEPRNRQAARRKLIPLTLLGLAALIYSCLMAYLPEVSTWHNDLINQLLHSDQQVAQTNLADSEWVSHSICLFKNLLHVPCLFCGLTRSFVLISQGQWLASLNYHLLGIPVYLVTLLFTFFSLIRPDWVNQWLSRVITSSSMFAILGIFTVCWLWKLCQHPRFW